MSECRIESMSEIDSHPLSVWFLDDILRVFPHGENGRIGRSQLSISNLEKDVAGPQPCGMRWAAFMYVLKHPTLFAIEVTAHERGTDRIATRNIWTFGMSKPSVARLQFAQQFLYLLLEFFTSSETRA